MGNFDVDPTTPEGSLPAWNSEGDVGYLRQRYRVWTCDFPWIRSLGLTWTQDWNPVVRALIDATPYTRLYPNWAGEPLSTWVFGSRATLVGDAAHTHGGAFAAGGSLAIDDAYALYLAFRHVFLSTKLADASVGRIEKALALYDRIRRPHTERLLEIVLNDNSNNKTIGKDDIVNAEDVLVQRIKNKPDTTWLSEHDVEKAFQNVIRDDDASTKGRHAAEVRGGSRL